VHRRHFLTSGLNGAALVSLAPSVPAFLASAARGAEPDRNGRILVVLELAGGNDGLNTVVPFRDDGYARVRPTLRLPGDQVVRLTDSLGLNPAMRGMGRLWEDGLLAIVQGVGYPNPNRSHFESLAIWHTASPESAARGSLGWIGRGLDGGRVPVDGGASALSVGDGPLPVALRGRRSVASSLDAIEAFRLTNEAAVRPQSTIPGAGDLAAFVQRSTLDAYATADRLAALAPDRAKNPSYPDTRLAARLRVIARLIRGGLGTRVYYTSQSGYDTHNYQLGPHNNLLGDLSLALLAFQKDLASAGLADRVLLMTFSEFGRRVAENGGRGTDHGTAGPVFLCGPRVRPGLIGTSPSLVDLDDADLKWSIDFRRIYVSLLEDWLGLPSRDAVGGAFERLPVVQV
jgi:uncharacterized protein (DUF1501 family)